MNDSFYGFSQYPEDVWVLVELQAEMSSPGGYDGILKVWNSRESGQIVKMIDRQDCRLRLSAYDWQNFIFGEYLTSPVQGDIMENIYTTLYYDDIYVDTSWARVAIGDTLAYTSCTHREIQIPTAWSDNSITFTVNQGSFSDGDIVYLFVVDENGNVSDGYPITFGSGLSGDVTGDDTVDITDVQACVNHILDLQDWGSAADVNADSAVNVLDVQAIVNIVLNG